ncbi:glycosyltransferase family 2 protein [Oscillatoria sp. FACHB-1406]|uniref:glycosyltransferase family 2 protein n=1 Tax=Oscillatoria sp. FACHB-1406 TaxID=2692846 RepID=UPI001686E6A7|nr:glycosyltransferase family 2 protein [Oscillatoria sp. FACHB-1406]MBD2578962.1 glycosyltransferase family 2 protein [Oscillatoria sp. FACHB-1406]
MNSQPIQLSIALVTRNRPESLQRCLQSWRNQTVAPWEIVVSDDSSDEYVPKNQAIAQHHNCKYLRGPQRGLYANRNHVSLSCGGTHILTGDDDHIHPSDYVEKVLEKIHSAPQRIWVFTERNFNEPPDAPLQCPGELNPKGGGRAPKNTDDCAAIADGSTAYPRGVFDSGLRYDDTYPFGYLWYLWGQVLVRHGWRISYSDATFVWHYCIREERERDRVLLQRELECNFYVTLVYNLWVQPSLKNTAWSVAALFRRVLLPDTIPGYYISTRIGILRAMRVLKLAIKARDRYRIC